MSWAETAKEKLRQGEEVVVKPSGQSMTPRIKSKQEVRVKPLDGSPEVGDVVLARCNGHDYLHQVTAVDGDRVQIGNNHGHINGWCSEVFGVAEI